MSLLIPLDQIPERQQERFGGKAANLATLQRRGYRIPRSRVIPTTVYRRYLHDTGLAARITMELGRKEFAQMRWEELWDAALRIRNLFLTTPLPEALEKKLATELNRHFSAAPLVLRSSAPGEDSGRTSFAGLHSSRVNVTGLKQQLLAVRQVWASLWSDRALLYRQKLQLEVRRSSMAVLVQELVNSDVSGVVFSRSPDNPDTLSIEAVRGLNQGLVDGSVEPDSWTLARRDLQILDHRQATTAQAARPGREGVELQAFSDAECCRPILTAAQLQTTARTALTLEETFGQPQDIEWTWADNQLILLQARPTTAHESHTTDPRRWYLNLHRNLENLKQLKERIETELIPGMEDAAQELARIDLSALTDAELAAQLDQRREIQHYWETAYRNDCIPMAHGIRLFGEFYNDALQPDDPFEFLKLLQGAGFRAVKRNQQLSRLAATLQKEQELTSEQQQRLESLAQEHGLLLPQIRNLLRELVRRPEIRPSKPKSELKRDFLEKFSAEDRSRAEEILVIGRASYRLRDDDNISLNKVNLELERAAQEARQRLTAGSSAVLQDALTAATAAGAAISSPALPSTASRQPNYHARQLQGQPASPGLASGPARVIRKGEDLAAFRSGEILVCDAIDPAMTFVVPLAAGIIERRGGMLIHGAIIAREYAIPCVSGISAAADIITTGDHLTLDGYLGLVFFPETSGHLNHRGQTSPLRKELDDAPEDN